MPGKARTIACPKSAWAARLARRTAQRRVENTGIRSRRRGRLRVRVARTIPAVGHELVELVAILGKAQALQEFLEFALLVFGAAQRFPAIIVESRVAARGGSPPIAAATAPETVHLRTHAIHFLLHALHLVFPVAVMTATHSSAPDHKGED